MGLSARFAFYSQLYIPKDTGKKRMIRDAMNNIELKGMRTSERPDDPDESRNYVFKCDCGLPIWIPLKALVRIPAHHVGIQCSVCKRLRSYHLIIPESGIQSPVKHIGDIACDMEGCARILPLFANQAIPVEIAAKRRELSKRKWDGLVCPGGHRFHLASHFLFLR
jgi:hypothetical protein